jgi:serine/threonine protein kinase
MDVRGSESGTNSSSSGRSPSTGAVSELRLKDGQLAAERYRVLSFVGQGAMGSVYKVEQVFLKKVFALKTLNSGAASDLVVRRFQKEARAASRLEHQNLVRAVDFGVIEGRHPFFVMEFVNGITLDRYLHEAGQMSVAEACSMFIPICWGMAYAHREGVIHRDIKPSNIVLVASEGEGTYVPKVVDFGIAKLDALGEADEQALTKTGEIFGTPIYMSPEQCAGDDIDNRSDIYSLGCVLFEALTGAPPFRGQSVLDTMMLHRTTQPVSLREASLGYEFPAGLEDVVAKMLVKDPAQRYRDCMEVARDLAALKLTMSGESAGSGMSRYFARLPGKFRTLGKLIASGSIGSILVVSSLLLSAVLVFSLALTREPVQSNVKTSAALSSHESHEFSIFDAVQNTSYDQDLAVLIFKHPTTEKLHLPDWKGSNNGLAALRNANQLKDLCLNGCPYITDDGLQYLCNLPLVKLDVSDVTVGDKSMEYVSRINSLEFLNLRRTDIGDKGCRLIARLPHLKFLNLSETGITGIELPRLSSTLPNLRELYLDYNNPSIRNYLPALRSFKNLSTLSLAKDSLTNEDINTLAQIRTLSCLNLADNEGLSDKGLLKLAQLPHLASLNVRYCNLSHAAILKFKELNPACKLDGLEVKRSLHIDP